MVVLGLHKDPWHNSGAAMINDDGSGVRLVNLAEERCNREKDSRKFPILSTQACMRELGVPSIHDVDLIMMDYIVTPDWQNDCYRRRCETDNFLAAVNPKKIHI